MPQLYDRALDPQERNNLWKQDPERVERMSALLREAFLRSAAFHESIDEGQAAQPMNPHDVKALAMLGYFGTDDTAMQRASLGQLPLALRGPLQDPYEAPDLSALIEADRAAQIIRRTLAGGAAPPGDVQRRLQEIGNSCIAWGMMNPHLVARVRWRVESLIVLAQQADVALDTDAWRQSFTKLDAQAASEPHR